jgi:hypothetical protein
MICANRHAIRMLLRGGSQTCDGYLSGGKLDRVADIPLFELPRIGLQVELKRKRVASVLNAWFS